MLPNVGFKSFVIFSAAINWLRLFTPDVELNIPEYINPVSLCSSSYGSSNVVDTLGPLSITGALKSSLILFDSTPLPNENALNHFKLFVLPKSLEALHVSC